jgi:Ribonuclease G/E
LGETCHQCGGGGTQPNARWVADNVLDRILRETAAAKGAALTVRVAPRVADDLGGAGGKLLTDLARQQGCRVHLIPDEALALEQFEIAAKQ